MKRTTLRIDQNINTDIKVGDRVFIINDETLTNMHFTGEYDLMRKYPTQGIHKPLEEVEGEVIETGITDFLVYRENKFVAYVQDILVKVGGAVFRTSSGAVRKIRSNEQIIEDLFSDLSSYTDNIKEMLGTYLEQNPDRAVSWGAWFDGAEGRDLDDAEFKGKPYKG